LIINIDQSRPVARMVGKKLHDRYISAYGDVLPVSKNFTARVMLVSGPWTDNPDLLNLGTTPSGRSMLELIGFIIDDPFWKSQIAEIYVDKKDEITFYTQVSKQCIEFGKPENIELKFKKLRIFYKEILPAKGWNTYERVSLKYTNQIVCE
jgi:cell division protein FtsQ